MDIGPTMTKWPGREGGGQIFLQKLVKIDFEYCFLGKIRGKNFLTQIWVFGSFFYPLKKIFLLVPSFQNMYRFFRDFQPLKRLVPTSSQMANFGQFLAKMGKTGIFSKKRLEHFYRAYKPELTVKFQKKVINGFLETALLTNEQI